MKIRNYIDRTLRGSVDAVVGKYPVVTITGPRQSGKTVLCQHLFPDLPYRNLEDVELRALATEDPKSFLSEFKNGAIIDEVQYVPELLSSIQVLVDRPDFDGLFVLTGSQNLLLSASITQSLAGRTALFALLPFCMNELPVENRCTQAEEYIFKGFYPRIYDAQIDPNRFYSDYITTYLERDVRSQRSVEDILLFRKFMGLCAGRTGSILNMDALASETGVSSRTARIWLEILELSYIVYRLPPFHRNISKRLVKRPKLYFYDVGLASHLLDIRQSDHLKNHPLFGALFETLVSSEIMKQRAHLGQSGGAYFYRDNHGKEVDLLLNRSGRWDLFEIKSAQTYQKEFTRTMKLFEKNVGDVNEMHLIYGGDQTQSVGNVQLMSYQTLHSGLRVE